MQTPKVIICPTPIGVCRLESNLPRVVYEDESTKVTISQLEASMRQDIFSHYDLLAQLAFSNYVAGEYAIFIEAQPRSIIEFSELQEQFDKLSFVFILACGYPLPIWHARVINDDGTSGSQQGRPSAPIMSNGFVLFNNSLTEGKLEELKKYSNNVFVNRDQKLNLIRGLFRTLCGLSNINLLGSLLVLLLESIFVPEGGGDLAYKFSIRMTKMLGGNHSNFIGYKKLYEKRSRYLHSASPVFNHTDIGLLGETTRNVVKVYLDSESSEGFSAQVLDELLLNRV